MLARAAAVDAVSKIIPEVNQAHYGGMTIGGEGNAEEDVKDFAPLNVSL